MKDFTDSQYELYRRSFLQDLNRHAAVVLEGRAIGKCFLDTYSVGISQVVEYLLVQKIKGIFLKPKNDS